MSSSGNKLFFWIARLLVLLAVVGPELALAQGGGVGGGVGAVPEPSTLTLLAAGLAGYAASRKRRG